MDVDGSQSVVVSVLNKTSSSNQAFLSRSGHPCLNTENEG